jgi:hypothetical protein
MRKAKKIIGYTVAWLSVPIVLATFIGMNFWAQQLASSTGVKVSPWFTGGEEQRIIAHNDYQTVIHRPVFDGLLWEKKEGFIQINWRPISALPPKIVEEIDSSGDGRPDFKIELEPARLQATLTPYNSSVLKLAGIYRLKDSTAVRVALHNSHP